MRKILAIILCVWTIFAITGCGKEKLEIGLKSEKVISDMGVSLTVKKDSISKNGATFTLTNDTDENIIYGADYELEIEKDNEWHTFNTQLNFILIGYTLNAHDSKELNINWKNSYVNLEPGKYRLIKSIVFEKDTGDIGSFKIASEFEIK